MTISYRAIPTADTSITLPNQTNISSTFVAREAWGDGSTSLCAPGRVHKPVQKRALKRDANIKNYDDNML